jgi:hypothetical protein
MRVLFLALTVFFLVSCHKEQVHSGSLWPSFTFPDSPKISQTCLVLDLNTGREGATLETLQLIVGDSRLGKLPKINKVSLVDYKTQKVICDSIVCMGDKFDPTLLGLVFAPNLDLGKSNTFEFRFDPPLPGELSADTQVQLITFGYHWQGGRSQLMTLHGPIAKYAP